MPFFMMIPSLGEREAEGEEKSFLNLSSSYLPIWLYER